MRNFNLIEELDSFIRYSKTLKNIDKNIKRKIFESAYNKLEEITKGKEGLLNKKFFEEFKKNNKKPYNCK